MPPLRDLPVTVKVILAKSLVILLAICADADTPLATMVPGVILIPVAVTVYVPSEVPTPLYTNSFAPSNTCIILPVLAYPPLLGTPR